MLRSRTCYCVLCAAITAALAALYMLAVAPSAVANPRGADATPLADKPISFINDVAPILKANCYACHDAKKHSGKLEMTSYATLRHGGANDDPITDSKPDESLIIELLTTDSEKRMPPPPKDKVAPTDGALPAPKIAIIKKWIKQGAKLDAGVASNADLIRELRKRWEPPAPPEKYPLPVVVTALAFTPDGQRLVAGGHQEITVWEAATGKLVQRIRTGPSEPMRSPSFQTASWRSPVVGPDRKAMCAFMTCPRRRKRPKTASAISMASRIRR